MDLLLNEQQRMLQSTVQDLLKRDFPKDVLASMDAGTQSVGERWENLASTGLLGSLIPTSYGGVGGTFSDAGVVFEELGKGPVPGPHFSSGVLAALTILEMGTEEQKQRYLPFISDGSALFTLALTEPDYGWQPDLVQLSAIKAGTNYRLNGIKLHVLEVTEASHAIIAARTNATSIGFFIVPTDLPGLSARALPGMSTGLGSIVLENVQVPQDSLLGEVEDAWATFASALLKATAVLSAYQVGGLDRVFEMCLTYSQTRRQFQQPIGRFQRVQDHIIDIVNYLDAARWTTYEALWKLDTDRPTDTSIHMAAALASEGYYLGCNSAHDVHAGVGIIREYGLTLHTKMSRTLYSYLGDPRYHRRKLAAALGL